MSSSKKCWDINYYVVWMLNPFSLYILKGKSYKIKTLVYKKAYHKNLQSTVRLMSYGRGQGKVYGRVMTNETVCVFLQSLSMWHESIKKLCAILSQAMPPIPFLPVGQVYQISSGSWPTFPLNLLQVCEFIWKLWIFLQ